VPGVVPGTPVGDGGAAQCGEYQGVDAFGQTGTLADLYRHYGIDAAAIMRAAQAIAPGRPIRHLAGG
jgi:pyruvate dehydrogenase complex dehydrogenase (E1) component